MYKHSALAVAIQANIPTIWWGVPGMGKTSIIRAIAGVLKWPIETIVVSQSEPSEINGLPVLIDGKFNRIPPIQATRLIDHGGDSIFFFDELSTAAPANQAATLRIAQERVIADMPLPELCRFVSAANPADSAAGGWDLTAPMSNRLWHYEGTTQPLEWTQGMIEGFPNPDIPIIPKNWRMYIPEWRAKVAGFINAQPMLLSNIPKDEASKGKPWPSERSWTMAADLLAAGSYLGEDVRAELATGCVGAGPARQFLGWLTEANLPNPRDLLKDYKSYPQPGVDDDHRAYAILSSVVAVVMADLTEQNWINAMKVIGYAATWNKDVCVNFMQNLLVARRKHMKKPMPETPEIAHKYAKEISGRMKMW